MIHLRNQHTVDHSREGLVTLPQGPNILTMASSPKTEYADQRRPRGRRSEVPLPARHCPRGAAMVEDREERFAGKAGPGFEVGRW